MERASGILMPVSALPGPYGIGSMGREAYNFVDFLADSGQRFWQLLPLGPTSCGNSPYSSFSTFAGNPLFIDLDALAEDGLIEKALPCSLDWGGDKEDISYDTVLAGRKKVLRRAFENGFTKYSAEISAFRRENSGWLENYALFMALKSHFDMLCWTQWPDEAIRLRRPEAVAKYTGLLRDEIDYHVFVQFLFFRQWDKLRKYAHKKGIEFIGDIPIYVALDSADLWSEPQYFQLGSDRLPREVAGVPPDGFTPDGQLWGNPLYDWEAMKRDGYGWWIRRIDGAGKLYDIIRIDHFRGFESYWSVPAGEKTAINGRWCKGPGMELVGVLTSWFANLSFIAEDLGYITPQVQKLLSDSGLPGMCVLEFAFDSQGNSGYLPHNIKKNSVCYAGTHDNDTVLGWLEDLSGADRAFAQDYMHITEDEGWCWGLIRTGMASPADLFIAQMQDLLELPTEARMNIPGIAEGNWQWRMKTGAADSALSEKLLKYTRTYRRCPIAPPEEKTSEKEKD